MHNFPVQDYRVDQVAAIGIGQVGQSGHGFCDQDIRLFPLAYTSMRFMQPHGISRVQGDGMQGFLGKHPHLYSPK